MRASYAFVLQKNNAEVSTYSVLTPTFIIEPNILQPKYKPRQFICRGFLYADFPGRKRGEVSKPVHHLLTQMYFVERQIYNIIGWKEWYKHD